MVYQDIMEVVESNDERAKEYKEKLMGKTHLENAPQEYWDVGLILSLNMTPDEWRALPLRDRGMIKARKIIENMVSIIDDHYKEQESKLKKGMGVGSSSGR